MLSPNLVVSSDSGIEPVFYTYYHPETRGLNFEGMIADMDVRFFFLDFWGNMLDFVLLILETYLCLNVIVAETPTFSSAC